MQGMATEELLDLSEILGSFSHGDHPFGHCNTKVTRSASLYGVTTYLA